MPSDEERRALAYQAHNSTVRIVNLAAREKGGSGVAVKLGTRYFVATVGHVIRGGEDILIPARSGETTVKDFVARRWDAEADVGLLELSPESAVGIADRFTDPARILTQLPDTAARGVLVVGYPGQYIAGLERDDAPSRTTHRMWLYRAFTYESGILAQEEWPTEGLTTPTLAGRDVFVSFDPEETIRLDTRWNAGERANTIDGGAPPLAGLSGGGIWLAAARSSPIWEPSVRLIALQVSYRPKGKWLRGVWIDHWLKLVESGYPDLREDVARLRKAKGIV